jgi:hypothetical protein
MTPDWLCSALEKLKSLYNIDSRWSCENKILGTDGCVHLTIDKKDIIFHVLIRRKIRSCQISDIQNKTLRSIPVLIIGRRIFPKIKKYFRDNDISYLEGNGNIYVKLEDIYIFMDSNKPMGVERRRIF